MVKFSPRLFERGSIFECNYIGKRERERERERENEKET